MGRWLCVQAFGEQLLKGGQGVLCLIVHIFKDTQARVQALTTTACVVRGGLLPRVCNQSTRAAWRLLTLSLRGVVRHALLCFVSIDATQ